MKYLALTRFTQSKTNYSNSNIFDDNNNLQRNKVRIQRPEFPAARNTNVDVEAVNLSKELCKERDPPIGYFFEIPDRKIISINGEDSDKLLDLKLTGNIDDLHLSNNIRAIYSLLLDDDQKVIFDCIIFRPFLATYTGHYDGGVEYWVDISEYSFNLFMNFAYDMKEEHKLSVEINDISDNFGVYNFHLTKPLTFKEGSVFSELQDDAPLYPDKKDTTKNCDTICVMDPRAKEMGVRVITPKDSIEVLDNMGVIQDNEMYKAFRYSLCIPEGSELFKRHPISTHLGKFNAIHILKSHLLDQDIIDYLKDNSFYPKSVMSFFVEDDLIKPRFKLSGDFPVPELNKKFDLDLKGEKVFPKNGNAIGKVIVSQYNLGLVMIDLNKLVKCKQKKFYIGGFNATLWLPETLDKEQPEYDENYTQKMKKRVSKKQYEKLKQDEEMFKKSYVSMKDNIHKTNADENLSKEKN